MQANLGDPLGGGGIVASYTYAARYRYSDTVVQNDNFLRISAGEDSQQTPLSFSVMTSPQTRPAMFTDGFGNFTHRVRLTAPHQEFTILAIGVVRLAQPQPVAVDVAMQSLGYDILDQQYLVPSPLVAPDRLTEAARYIASGAASLMESVGRVVDWVYGNIQYQAGRTNVSTTADQVMAAGHGVCQDMAHLTLGLLRALGIPARYVSGLLATQAGDTHAWLEFLHPQLGWVTCDPTRGKTVVTDADLVKFAVGRDYSQASPVEGSFVCKGSGWLETVMAQVLLGGRTVSFDDAQELIANP
jgi:transglutaminase-like putative cysteine protease